MKIYNTQKTFFTNDVVIYGSLSALSGSTFSNTIFTTTSALSVVNTGPGPALYVYQAAGNFDVASFYDGDGIEVLHVGNAQPGGNSRGKIGINESFPGAELTVNGAISGNNGITVAGTTSFGSGSASGTESFAQGKNTLATGDRAHAEGDSTVASGDSSHTEGYQTSAFGTRAHAEGLRTLASGNDSHAQGGNTWASGIYSHTEGYATSAFGNYSHAEGGYTFANASGAHAEGYLTLASGGYTHAEGRNTSATNWDCHAEGYFTLASGNHAHAEGAETVASGDNCHAEGSDTFAIGNQSHTEGYGTSAFSAQSHAEGSQTTARGNSSHAEGWLTSTGNTAAHAEGYLTVASGAYSHTEGQKTSAYGNQAHAEGFNTAAGRDTSHAAGRYAEAAHDRTWIWKGSTSTFVISTTRTDQFLVSAAGGIFFPGNVGIGTDNNSNALTVAGAISSNGTITALGGNSNNWNSVYSTVNSLSSIIPDPATTISAQICVGTTALSSINFLNTSSAQLLYTVPANKVFLVSDFCIIIDAVVGTSVNDGSLPTFRLYRHDTLTNSTNQVTNTLTPVTASGNTITTNRYYKTGGSVTALNGKALVSGNDTSPQNKIWFRVDSSGTNTFSGLSGRVIVIGNLI